MSMVDKILFICNNGYMITNIYLKLIPNRIKLKLIQQGYDYGFDRGYISGKQDREHEIVNLISDKVDNLSWVDEEVLEARQVIPMITKKEEVLNGWKL
jgi:hypothetical protein